MEAATASTLTALWIMKVVFGALCLTAVVSVGVAAWLDLKEKRSWHKIVPPCWPPPGIDPADAYADDLAGQAPTSSPSVPAHEGEER